MALDLAGLQDDIEAMAAEPGATIADCAQQWADAMQAYAAGVIPATTTAAAAAETLRGALAAAFAQPAAAPAMEAAFLAFATTIGTGMAGAGWAGLPPAGPVGFATQFAPPYPETHEEAGEQIGTLIDAWMKTGTATLIAPPNTPVAWS